MRNLTDTILIIRCPYCLVGIECRPMIAIRTGGSSAAIAPTHCGPEFPSTSAPAAPALEFESDLSTTKTSAASRTVTLVISTSFPNRRTLGVILCDFDNKSVFNDGLSLKP